MKVSVILPVHNRAATIMRALHSVAIQSPPFEILLVDDCSEDNTLQVVESCTSIPVRTFKESQKSNANVARNTAIKHSEGDIVVFLDSDDEMLPGRLETLRREYRTGSFDVTVGNFTTQTRARRNSFGFRSSFLSDGSLHQALAYHAFPITFSAIAIRRQALAAMGPIDPCVQRHQDRDFLFCAHSSGLTINFRNSNDVIKHQSRDSFSRSPRNYMQTLEHLVRKHNLFSTDSEIDILQYFVLRSLISSVLRGQLVETLRNYKVYSSSPCLMRNRPLRPHSYLSGKNRRKACQESVIYDC